MPCDTVGQLLLLPLCGLLPMYSGYLLHWQGCLGHSPSAGSLLMCVLRSILNFSSSSWQLSEMVRPGGTAHRVL
jgi:hypothetical protein